MNKKFTVNEIAYLLMGNSIISVDWEEESERWWHYEHRYDITDFINKFGDKYVNYISFDVSDGDECLIIELEGKG